MYVCTYVFMYVCIYVCTRLLTSRVGTLHILRDVLQDYAERHGWHPLVCVLPQPDDQAVHPIPAAADAGLVSVLFRNEAQLYPCCVARTLRYGHILKSSCRGGLGDCAFFLP